ncbi:mitochondrial carrier [Radiomyces spectabilis]|uniref:mitochondrial carrier n=1 Tax=Radiomyces spectabilis TaxID=64574 RepID=UPI00221EE49B|nr:mitochondrial carrier [Radiomyces spectabilis]KAI8381093.1 mitochondrial carrier [Radiomyces spectabilis]
MVRTSSFAGMAQVIVGQPLDTIKVRLQVDQSRFKGAWDCGVQTVKNEGFFALYKGMASPLVGIGAVNALLFAANSRIKKAMQTHPDDPLSIGQIALAGAGAGIVNSVLASPVELLKIKMQAQYGSASTGQTSYYKGPIDCVKHLIRQHGFGNGFLLWGMSATVAREIPAYAGFYAGFETMRRTLTRDQQEPASVWQLMASGATGGISYWLACYPLDVVKSVAQNEATPPKGFYIIRILLQIYARDGVQGLFRGITPSIVRSIPAAAVTFTTYELSMRAFESAGWV